MGESGYPVRHELRDMADALLERLANGSRYIDQNPSAPQTVLKGWLILMGQYYLLECLIRNQDPSRTRWVNQYDWANTTIQLDEKVGDTPIMIVVSKKGRSDFYEMTVQEYHRYKSQMTQIEPSLLNSIVI